MVGGGCGGGIRMCGTKQKCKHTFCFVGVVKVVELTARGKASRGKPASGIGDKHPISRVVVVVVVGWWHL